MSRRVAIIGTRGYPSYYGGFETAVRRLAPYLCDRGWDVTVYGRPGATKDGDIGRDFRVKSVVTRGLETTSLSTLSFGFTAVADAARNHVDVALVMNVANGFWLPLLKHSGIPTVVNVDGIEWERAKWGRVAKATFKQGARVTAKYADEIVADSLEIARHWKENFRRESSFIPYGADVPEPLPVPLGLEHRGYILLVARFVPENTVDEFFAATERLAARHQVVIVGSSGYGGPYDEQARNLAARHQKVMWLGHVSDDQLLFALWQHAGAYFHGHSVGGTNPALVQAMACGTPVIARNTVYNREVLGPGGIFVEPDCHSIMHGLETSMRSASRFDPTQVVDRAREHYSWDDVCQRYESVLATALLERNESRIAPAV